MDTSAPAATASVASPSPTNPHVLWRQLLGLILWVGVLSLSAGGPIGAALCLALGAVTFTDAWKAGIYKRPGQKSFLNMSPMAWGIAMALLFIITYPAYLLNRNKLRTRSGTDAYFCATGVLGAIVIVLFILDIVARITLNSR